NPPAGTCTLIEAIVTLNGATVRDGTGVAFSTDFGVFAQNGLPLISVVTQNGAALTALCSEFPGTAVVRATSTVGSQSASATITIAFQPAAAGAGPFVSFCDPSFGPSTGGTALALHGGRFCPTSGCTGGEAATTRVLFTVNGVSREATVTSVTNDVINVLTPGFPEVTSPTTPVEIRVTLRANTASPVVLSLPNCFAFGTTTSTTPTITAVLPASGANEGNTRVTIIGAGFDAAGGVQVFFGDVEATIVSVSFNQIVVLTPAAFGSGRDNLNETVDVRVRNIRSGLETTLEDGYRYTQPLQLISITNNEQRVDQPFTPVTIFGHGFQAPVAVTLAGRPATVISVSESELVVLPSRPLDPCASGSGAVVVTNINTGDTVSGLTFTYTGGRPTITQVLPSFGPPGTVVTLNGQNLPSRLEDASVLFENAALGVSVPAAVSATSETQMTVTAPAQTVLANPLCTGGNPAGTLQNAGPPFVIRVTNLVTGCSGTTSFQYQLPCALATATPTATATGTPPPTSTPTPTPIPGADLGVVKVDSPDPVASTTNVTYTVTITNNGPGTAVDMVMNDPLPTGTTFVSCSSSLGSCSGPTVGTNGTVTASLPGNLGPGGVVTVTIVANVTAGGGSVLSNTATASSSTADPSPGNNSDSETTTVGPPPP
ncbi:MAG TPA: IPT/TIG domain-containing protein, partial [Thermoanaerobaculia bacterium]|nr:IPT/TIG domain-containing protein [Thermoanaerobaculia bacterium]